MANMEEVFRDLEKAGKTDVENLIRWMKASKLIEAAKDSHARKLFKDADDQQRIELAQFKEIVAELAQKQSKTFDQVSKELAAEGPKFIDAAITGLQAFKEALSP